MRRVSDTESLREPIVHREKLGRMSLQWLELPQLFPLPPVGNPTLYLTDHSDATGRVFFESRTHQVRAARRPRRGRGLRPTHAGHVRRVQAVSANQQQRYSN